MASIEANKGRERTPKPALLDVVRLEGRWAQVRAAGNIVRYLSSGQYGPIKWEDWRLLKLWNTSVGNLDLHGEKITEQEITNIHWGPEEEQKPKLKLEVTVFGDYSHK